MAKSKSAKIKVSPEQEEQIIEFVKSNEVIYNVKHKQFRDSEMKNRLWLKLSQEMNLEGNFNNFILLCVFYIWIDCIGFFSWNVKKKMDHDERLLRE